MADAVFVVADSYNSIVTPRTFMQTECVSRTRRAALCGRAHLTALRGRLRLSFLLLHPAKAHCHAHTITSSLHFYYHYYSVYANQKIFTGTQVLQAH